MWLVFDQLWPVRTVTVMRRGFASVLRLGADILTIADCAQSKQEILRQADIFRDQVGKTVAGLRSANTAVPYDFSPDRDRHIQEGDSILRATLTAAALFWNELAILHALASESAHSQPGMRELRQNLASRLAAISGRILRNKSAEAQEPPITLEPDLLSNPHHGEYARNLIARYEELEKFVVALD